VKRSSSRRTVGQAGHFTAVQGIMLIMPLTAGLRLCQVWGHTKEVLIATISGACMGVVRTVGGVCMLRGLSTSCKHTLAWCVSTGTETESV
jgi:hypothetical protein